MIFQNKNIFTNIILVIFLTIVFPIILGKMLTNFITTEYINIPLHSALEVAGGVIAIIISIIFYIKFSKKQIMTHFSYSTIALLSMGVIDIFHGMVMTGEIFVWLHSCAVFFGGVLFTTIWLRNKKISINTYKRIPFYTILFSFSLSLFSIIFPEFIPTMLNEDKTFSTFANILNTIGGIGFFIASLKYIQMYIVNNAIEDLLFTGLTMLFGIAGILFASSVLWEVQWWLWHFLRLTAYFIALYILYSEFDGYIKLIETTNEKLDNANKKIGKYINLVDINVITSSTDLHGKITHVSQAFCEISSYSKDELIGQNHKIVKHKDMDKSVYKRLWLSLENNKDWSGELKNRKKDGSYYWVHAVISPIFDEKNEKIGYTAIRQDITDKKRIEELSITDALTNIYNRRHFNDIFPKIIYNSKRNNKLISFLIIDIDHFKQYNDTYGHQMGDTALIKVASTIKNSLKREHDICFRLGGEEFGVIYKTSTKEASIELANTIRKNIEDLHIEHAKNSASKYITASMGLVCENSNDIKNEDEIYRDGDELLYKAKESGRNKIIFN